MGDRGSLCKGQYGTSVERIRKLDEWERDGCIYINRGRDFNARTEEKKGRMKIRSTDEGGRRRRGRGKGGRGKINKERRRIVESLKEKGWGILNCTREDEARVFTFIGGRGETLSRLRFGG